MNELRALKVIALLRLLVGFKKNDAGILKQTQHKIVLYEAAVLPQQKNRLS
jgi:hypothetical protein